MPDSGNTVMNKAQPRPADFYCSVERLLTQGITKSILWKCNSHNRVEKESEKGEIEGRKTDSLGGY